MVNTTISISTETKDRLLLRKLTRSESYDEIIIRLLNDTESKE
jgi:hypothetical protein